MRFYDDMCNSNKLTQNINCQENLKKKPIIVTRTPKYTDLYSETIFEIQLIINMELV